jgi:hypothetical protein
MASPAFERIPITKFSSTELKNGIPSGWNFELRQGKPNIQIERLDLSGLPPLKRHRHRFSRGLINAHNTKTQAESHFCDVYFTKN